MVISGDRVYASENIGCPRNWKIVEGGVRAQTVSYMPAKCVRRTWIDLTPSMKRAALENMSVVLRAAGSGLEHVIKANIYLTDMVNDFQPMNEV